MSGRPDGTFDATNTITRAEAVSSLNRVMGNVTEEDVEESKDVVVTEDDTVIDGQTIEGNLVVDKAVGDGEVYVKNTTVKGDIIIQGGGDDSVYLTDVTVNGKVSVEKENVRVQFVGKTEVSTVEVKTVCQLQGRNFEGTIGTIAIVSDLGTDAKVKVDVPAKAVDVLSKASVAVNADVETVTVSEDATDSKLEVISGATVGTVVADGKVAISGSGKIEKLEANADGITVSSSTDVTDTVVADGVEKPSTPSTGGGSSSSSSGGSSSGSGGETIDQAVNAKKAIEYLNAGLDKASIDRYLNVTEETINQAITDQVKNVFIVKDVEEDYDIVIKGTYELVDAEYFDYYRWTGVVTIKEKDNDKNTATTKTLKVDIFSSDPGADIESSKFINTVKEVIVPVGSDVAAVEEALNKIAKKLISPGYTLTASMGEITGDSVKTWGGVIKVVSDDDPSDNVVFNYWLTVIEKEQTQNDVIAKAEPAKVTGIVGEELDTNTVTITVEGVTGLDISGNQITVTSSGTDNGVTATVGQITDNNKVTITLNKETLIVGERIFEVSIPVEAITGVESDYVQPVAPVKTTFTVNVIEGESSNTSVTTQNPSPVSATIGTELTNTSVEIAVNGAKAVDESKVKVGDDVTDATDKKNGITATATKSEIDGNVKITLTGTPEATTYEEVTFKVIIPQDAITQDTNYTVPKEGLTATVTVNVEKGTITQVGALSTVEVIDNHYLTDVTAVQGYSGMPTTVELTHVGGKVTANIVNTSWDCKSYNASKIGSPQIFTGTFTLPDGYELDAEVENEVTVQVILKIEQTQKQS